MSVSSVIDKLHFSEQIRTHSANLIKIGSQRLGFRTFGYRRYLMDGRSFGFSNDSEWNLVFLEKFSGRPVLEYYSELSEFISTGKSLFLRVGHPKKENKYFTALYENNVWNTLSLYQYNSELACIESFFLCSTKENTQIIERYMNEMHFLNDWIKLVKNELSTLLEPLAKSFFTYTVPDTLLNCLQEKYISNVGVEFDPLRLSDRENAVLGLMLADCSRKSIARTLNVSPKTVDSYVGRLKEKTGALSKNRLLKIAADFQKNYGMLK
ncbi:MAG TPA: LuxR C-terminal-related transcriptional regulator [Gammaproteobacteria bacterium]|nr:LuxR C-terminal-related transcriptional regulator [Gammaproteobacteria bacterium]